MTALAKVRRSLGVAPTECRGDAPDDDRPVRVVDPDAEVIAAIKADPAEPIATIALRFGISYERVRSLRRRIGLPTNARAMFFDRKRREIEGLDGAAREVAQRLGVSEGFVKLVRARARS